MATEPELDQIPPQEQDSSSDLMIVLRNLNRSSSTIPNTLATKDLYDMVLQDRPGKFNEEQVQFKRGAGDEEGSCGTCFHYYVGDAAKHRVCEIFRPKDDSNIEKADRCIFFTTDGVNFPFVKKTTPAR